MAVMQAVFEESNCVLKRCWIFMEENNMREIGSNEDTQIENIEISELAIKNLIYVVGGNISGKYNRPYGQ